MTMTIQTEQETIVKTKVGELKKGDILAYMQDTSKKVKITHIEFNTWQGNKVAFFDFIELDTLKTRYYQFIDCELEFLKVLGYEHLEQINLRCECNKLLGKATFKGVIELKCPKCKTVNTFSN